MAQTTVNGRYVGGALYQSKPGPNGDLKFSACVVLNDGEEKKIEAAMDKAIAEEFGGKVPKNLQRWGARMGDDEEYEHSFDRYFINPKSNGDKPRPRVCTRVAGKLEDTEDVYAGCYVAVSVKAYAYKGNKEKKIQPGASLQLRGVLFTKDGERLGDSFKENEFEGFDSELDEDAFGESGDDGGLLD